MPIERAMNWAGGFTDAKAALDFMASGGIPAGGLVEGGRIATAQLEHVWVEAWIDYIPSRGSRHKEGDTWIRLDGSFKQYNYTQGLDLYTAMGINGEQYLMDYISDTTSSPIPVELQNMFTDYNISPYQYYSKRLLDYIDANYPSSSIEDIIGDETIALSKKIIKEEFPYLLGTLPYRVVARGAAYASIPDSLRHKLSFSIENDYGETSLSYSVSLPEMSRARVTLSYLPATSADEALVTQHGGLLNVPPYLINVTPVIKVNGAIAASGNPVGLGYGQIFSMTFKMPNKTDIVSNMVTAGDYLAVAVQYYKTPSDIAGNAMAVLFNNTASSDLDDLLGQMLYNIGLSYMHHLSFEEELYAKNFQMVTTREPSEAMVTSQAVTDWLWGVPVKVTEGGIGIDVDRNVYAAFPLDGDRQRKKDFMIVSGLGSSAWEDKILESFFNVPSVSAAKLLKRASSQGIPIYTIDSDNLFSVLPQLQVADEVVGEIQNAINAGMEVIISKTNVQYNDWDGVGYIVYDPVKGSGAYMISSGTAGADTTMPLPISLRELNALYARLCDQRRWVILTTAGSLLGTPYRMGKKDPASGYIDCSGLVTYCYKAAGINLVGRAIDQANSTEPTDYPLYSDLVFFHGTYDRDGNKRVEITDTFSHVGIALPYYRWMIHAGGKGVDLKSIDEFVSYIDGKYKGDSGYIMGSGFGGFRYSKGMETCK